jgi:hypothetical protein
MNSWILFPDREPNDARSCGRPPCPVDAPLSAADLESRALTHYVPQDFLEKAVRTQGWTLVPLDLKGACAGATWSTSGPVGLPSLTATSSQAPSRTALGSLWMCGRGTALRLPPPHPKDPKRRPAAALQNIQKTKQP